MEAVVGVVVTGIFAFAIFMCCKFKQQKGAPSGGQVDDPFRLPPPDDHEAGPNFQHGNNGGCDNAGCDDGGCDGE